MKAYVPDKSNPAYNFWKNMIAGNCYIKGEHDSTTDGQVLACRSGSTFAPHNCFFAFVHELPDGTCYVDDK